MRIISIIILFLLFISLNGRANDHRLVVAIPSYLNSHVPGKGWSYYQRYLMNSVYQRLFSYNQFGHIKGELLTSWKISDNHRTIEFKIKKGVKFSDGSPLTIDDVIYSFSKPFWGSGEGYVVRILGETVGAVGGLEEGKILNCLEKIDNYSFRLELRKPYVPLFDLLSSYLFPIVKKDNASVGSGPYLAVKLAEDRWHLSRNHFYNQTKLRFTEIELQSVFEPSQVQKMLEKEDVSFLVETGRKHLRCSKSKRRSFFGQPPFVVAQFLQLLFRFVKILSLA